MNSLEIKEKNEIKFFTKNKSKQEASSLKEKIILTLEINNCIKDNIYSLKIIYSDNEFKDSKTSDFIKSSISNSSLQIFQYNCEYKFEKEQNLFIEIKINDNKKLRTYNIQTSIGEIIGNENNNKNGIKLYDLNETPEQLKIKSEKKKTNIKFVIVHFTLKISPEMNNQAEYVFFKNNKYKIYYIIEKEGKKLYESETFTDNGKFNIVQIPVDILNSDFNISFYNYKNQQIGSIKTNIKDFTNLEKKGHIFFINRLTMKEILNLYNFSFIREEITFLDYISKGVRIGLNIGIDFTQSNRPTDDPKSLHCLLKEKRPNPYERAILSCAKILEYYDYDKLFPVYGFGAVIKGRYKTSMCFNINFKEDPNIQYIENIIKEYVNCMDKIDFACPTYFAPIINKIINDIKSKKDILDYQLLMILTDGMIQDLEDTIEALVEGSFYPLSIIIIGIGDSDFSKMKQLDGDEIPLKSKKYGIKRLRDLVQFVPFSKFEKDEKKLISQVLEEIPRQVIDYYTLNFLYPEILNVDFINENNFINEIKNDNHIDASYIEDKSELFMDASFRLFEDNKKNNNIDKEQVIWNYDEANLMFNYLSNNDNKNLNIFKNNSHKINRDFLNKNIKNIPKLNEKFQIPSGSYSIINNNK